MKKERATIFQIKHNMKKKRYSFSNTLHTGKTRMIVKAVSTQGCILNTIFWFMEIRILPNKSAGGESEEKRTWERSVKVFRDSLISRNNCNSSGQQCFKIIKLQ